MNIYYEISESLNIPSEFILINSIIDNICFFSTKAGAKYSCKLTKNQKHIIKNSVRID